MAEYQIVVDGFLNEPLTGRRPIETPETEINRANVLKVVMGKAEPIHLLVCTSAVCPAQALMNRWSSPSTLFS